MIHERQFHPDHFTNRTPWPAGTRTRALALFVLLAFLVMSVLSLCGASGEDVKSNKYLPACAGTGCVTFLEWRDSSMAQLSAGARQYLEIPRTILFDAFVDRLRQIGPFSNIVLAGTAKPHDLDLTFQIDRLERKPVTAADDLWVECSLDLSERTSGRPLWFGRFALPVEVRALNARIENPSALYPLLARLAGARMADSTALGLRRRFTGAG